MVDADGDAQISAKELVNFMRTMLRIPPEV